MNSILEWLSSQHSLTLSGWVWVVLTCLGGFLGIMLVGLSMIAKFAGDFIDAFTRR